MKNAILFATVTVSFVTASCAMREERTSAQRSVSEPSSSEPGQAAAQPDPDCSDGAPPQYAGSPMFSGTHIGEADGTVDLGNGQSASIHFLPKDPGTGFTAFAWSATTPIALVKFTYLANDPANAYGYFPAAMSGETYYILKNGPATALPADEVVAKFCYVASPTPPVDAGSGGEGPDAGGNDDGTDGGGPEPGGGKTW